MLKSEMKQPTYRANKELRSVRVGPRVGHAQNSLALVRQFKVFVVEFGSVNGFSSRAIVVCEVPLLVCGSSRSRTSVRNFGENAVGGFVARNTTPMFYLHLDT